MLAVAWQCPEHQNKRRLLFSYAWMSCHVSACATQASQRRQDGAVTRHMKQAQHTCLLHRRRCPRTGAAAMCLHPVTHLIRLQAQM